MALPNALTRPTETQDDAARADGHATSPAWRRHGRNLALALALPVGLAIGWEAAVAYGLFEGRLMPPPSRIVAAFQDLALYGDLWLHVWATLWRVLVGFGCGAVAGMALGAISGASGLMRNLLDPTLQALRSVPSIAWVPLFILWFGIFETSKVVLIAVGVMNLAWMAVLTVVIFLEKTWKYGPALSRITGVSLIVFAFFVPAHPELLPGLYMTEAM